MKKLLRTLFAAIAILAFSFTSDAGDFGVKGGVNVTQLSVDGVKNYVGYHAGLTMQFHLPLWFSIQPDLLFHVKGGKIQDVSMQALGMGYLELPINVQWGPSFLDGKIRAFVQASPYIGYAVSKDIKDASGTKYTWNNINRFEYGAGVGVGLRLWAFQVTAQYNWSLGPLASFAEGSPFEKLNKSNFSGYTVSLAILF